MQLGLPQLLLQHGDLIARRARPRFELRQRRPRLILARAHLLVVEHRDDVAGLDRIALAHADLEDAAAEFRRHRRLVSLDSAAERDDGV